MIEVNTIWILPSGHTQYAGLTLPWIIISMNRRWNGGKIGTVSNSLAIL